MCRTADVEGYIRELALLEPVYVEGGGDMTRIVLQGGGSWLDPHPVPVVLKGIARYFGVDLTAIRERYGDILGKRLHVPLPLSGQLVLLPVKMRRPRIAKDGTTGYVAAHLVEEVRAARTEGCSLQVAGAGTVSCLQSAAFARQQLRHARIVHTFYMERMGGGYERISLPS